MTAETGQTTVHKTGHRQAIEQAMKQLAAADVRSRSVALGPPVLIAWA